MADQLLNTDHRQVGHELASISGVDVAKARPATLRAWEARGLALHHLSAGDVAEALKVTVAAASGPSRTPAVIQPRTAAKERR
ncbi:hypothetical protein HH110_11140 [Stenotrophomonas sp. SAM-B]|uniref:hypothetical protein n=1 Tax=Stenotrophomonas sp. SAM-B TaxID=2729141 RepID=UPI0015A413FB|nr:hypothetical protein [Stenotrophomonas sp. SAM-B]NWF33591.1 hypothetical protein [Stenotrophomonas sp. SAM-B]